MKTQNIIFTLSVVLFLHTHSAAQCTLTGKIIDKASGEPIAYANIALYNAKDSVLVSGTITSDKGEFLAGNLKIGKYNFHRHTLPTIFQKPTRYISVTHAEYNVPTIGNWCHWSNMNLPIPTIPEMEM